MSNKKSGFGTFLLIGAVVAAAGGAVAYWKKAEIKRITEDVMGKLKPTDEEGVYTADIDGDGTPDIIMADTTGDGKIDTVMMDTTGDGKVDSIAIDTTGDGKPDYMATGLSEEDFAQKDDTAASDGKKGKK